MGYFDDWVYACRYGRARARECGGIEPSGLEGHLTFLSVPSHTGGKNLEGTMGALLVGMATVMAMLGLMNWTLAGESDAERRRLDQQG